MHHPSRFSPKERLARAKLQKILRECGLIRASWVKLSRTCGHPGCRCAKSKQYWHDTWYITQSQKGQLRRKSIQQVRYEEVDRWVKDYWQARQLLDRISQEYWLRLEKPRKIKK